MVMKPFAAGYDNLSLLFESNKRLYLQLKTESHQQQLTTLTNLGDNKKLISLRTKAFLIRYVRLHGDLFLWTRMAFKVNTVAISSFKKKGTKEDENGVNSEGETVELNEFDVDSFLVLNQEVLDDFDSLISASAFSDGLLLKLLVISLFSVHHSGSILSQISTNLNNDITESEECKKNETSVPNSLGRSVTESLSLSLLFSIVKRSVFIAQYHHLFKSIIFVTHFYHHSITHFYNLFFKIDQLDESITNYDLLIFFKQFVLVTKSSL